MKKLALLFAGLSLFAATGCSDDNDTVRESPLVGTWQPLKEVVTTVEVGEDPVSNTITYTDCQKQSTWVFSVELKGKQTTWQDDIAVPGQCAIQSEINFNYTYDKDAKSVQMKIQGIVEPVNAKVITLDDTTLNLAVREETQDPTIFQTRTYTFKRIPQ